MSIGDGVVLIMDIMLRDVLTPKKEILIIPIITIWKAIISTK